ncbi:DUF7192 family protein [Flavobacterium nackdongense]|uniref:DUF7192 domain-containing protein n=1 Tax=Flavobacterium nackdongense TaxID=2547394 RepID=A0A4V1AGE8_9FLAO|nr:hypothetical protein [Flavobacterium nackdongense]QBN17792.1 hypothetical protein E1750_02915 [Flavobacterium nackdongense]
MNKHLIFDDLYDFQSYAFRQSNARIRSSRGYATSWSGGLDWKESKKLALTGWQDGLVEVDKFQARVNELITSKIIRHKPVYAVAGNYIDIGNYLSNDPECFITKEYDENNQQGKIITIVCSISFSAGISPEIIIQRGAMICALVDAIEYAGYRAEVVCNDASSNSPWDRDGNNKEVGWFEIDVTIKKANQPLNRIELAFCLAHPAMLRKLMFSIAEIEGWSDYATNYGYPSKATNKGDIYIEEVFTGVVSDNKAIHWIVTELQNLGITIEKK